MPEIWILFAALFSFTADLAEKWHDLNWKYYFTNLFIFTINDYTISFYVAY